MKCHAIDNVPKLGLPEGFPTVIIKIQLIPFAAPRFSIISDTLFSSRRLTARLKISHRNSSPPFLPYSNQIVPNSLKMSCKTLK